VRRREGPKQRSDRPTRDLRGPVDTARDLHLYCSGREAGFERAPADGRCLLIDRTGEQTMQEQEVMRGLG